MGEQVLGNEEDAASTRSASSAQEEARLLLEKPGFWAMIMPKNI
jgi:hypothetical protein